MTESIKHCPQPDPPELVIRADGYHYADHLGTEMKELTDEDLDRLMKENVVSAARCPPGWRNFARALIAADRTLNAPADMLRKQLQRRCSDWGAYWRASDSHGVELSQQQAVDLLEEALGVEVELAVAPSEQNAAPADRDVMRQTLEAIGTGVFDGTECARQARKTLALAPTPPAELSSDDDTLSPVYKTADEMIVALDDKQQEKQEPVAFRHLHEGEWEYYDAPTGSDCEGCQKLYTSPSSAFAELRARVQALAVLDDGRRDNWVRRVEVLAEIDKLGGKV